MTSPNFKIPPDLKDKFPIFYEIADLTQQLRHELDTINTMNKTAAGTSDQYALAYHAKVDQPTADLSSLVDAISAMFSLTGDNGSLVTQLFEYGDQTAGMYGSTF